MAAKAKAKVSAKRKTARTSTRVGSLAGRISKALQRHDGLAPVLVSGVMVATVDELQSVLSSNLRQAEGSER